MNLTIYFVSLLHNSMSIFSHSDIFVGGRNNRVDNIKGQLWGTDQKHPVDLKIESCQFQINSSRYGEKSSNGNHSDLKISYRMTMRAYDTHI